VWPLVVRRRPLGVVDWLLEAESEGGKKGLDGSGPLSWWGTIMVGGGGFRGVLGMGQEQCEYECERGDAGTRANVSVACTDEQEYECGDSSSVCLAWSGAWVGLGWVAMGGGGWTEEGAGRAFVAGAGFGGSALGGDG
jgi:hypothetical protein